MASSDKAHTAALSVNAGAAKRPRLDLMAQQRLWGWLFISPWIIGLIIFTGAPIIFSLLFTFTNFNLSHPEEIQFIGLQNWQRLFTAATGPPTSCGRCSRPAATWSRRQ